MKIGVTQVVNHASLDEAYKGFVQALKDNGYTEGDNLVIDYQNAQGDNTNAATIAQKFATSGSILCWASARPSPRLRRRK